MPYARFPLGKIVGTPSALEALERNGESPVTFFARHQAGDWGEIDDHDRAENETSLKQGFRLLSAYTLADGTRIWVITEADRFIQIAPSGLLSHANT